MGDRSPDADRPEDRLDSWKEIAAYLNRDVTTVQRWEKREGMPVHRHVHERRGSVYAFQAELAEWAHNRSRSVPEDNTVASPNPSAFAPPSLAPEGTRTRWKIILALTAAGVAAALGITFWLQKTERFWVNPIADARFRMITDFDGVEPAAAVSRDGHLVAFLSDQDGTTDVWVTQVGSGQFHNLTRGSARDILISELRTPGFSPDGSLVTYWNRREPGSAGPRHQRVGRAGPGGPTGTIS